MSKKKWISAFLLSGCRTFWTVEKVVALGLGQSFEQPLKVAMVEFFFEIMLNMNLIKTISDDARNAAF